jgi:exosortase
MLRAGLRSPLSGFRQRNRHRLFHERLQTVSGQLSPTAWLGRVPRNVLLAALGLALVFAWVFWPSISGMASRWTDAEYSHGYLVPLFSLYLLWRRRDLLGTEPLSPSWWGLAVLTGGLVVRAAGTYIYFDWLATAALLPCLAGVVLLFGGMKALRWAWPAIAFLAFMIPLPFRVETALALPLQRMATAASTFFLQTLGFMAFSEGIVIRMGEVRIGVVEACSGLSMLLIFAALATAIVLVVERPWLDKAVILLSAIPVALAANILRITVTGILYKTTSQRLAELVFHDLAGWLMMPLALGMIWLELRVLDWVLIPVEDKKPLQIGRFGRRAPAVVRPVASTRS